MGRRDLLRPCRPPRPAARRWRLVTRARIQPFRRLRLVGAEDARGRHDRHRHVQCFAHRAAVAGQGGTLRHQSHLHVGARPLAARHGHHHRGRGPHLQSLHQPASRKFPRGWAFDSQGVPTTNTAEAYHGMLMPLGGYKGSGLAFMVEILCGGAERRRHGQRSGRHPLSRPHGARQPDVHGHRCRPLHAGGGVHGAHGSNWWRSSKPRRPRRATTKCWWPATRNGAPKPSAWPNGIPIADGNWETLVKTAARVHVPAPECPAVYNRQTLQ